MSAADDASVARFETKDRHGYRIRKRAGESWHVAIVKEVEIAGPFHSHDAALRYAVERTIELDALHAEEEAHD